MRRQRLFLLIVLVIVSLGVEWAIAAKEAFFYKRLKGNYVNCQLCPRGCTIPEGGKGFCRVRENRGRRLYTLVYSRPCSVNVGPIEKAPFYHFLPGHKRLCISTVGCNLRCKYCHNWPISQVKPGEVKEYDLSPEEVVKEAKRLNLTSISFTYTEPTVFYEYLYDIAKLAKKEGIRSSVVSNGYIEAEPLKRLLRVVDAVKVDLKGFTKRFYQEVCSAELTPVLDTLKLLKEEGAYFEIVNLIVPTLNDSPSEIRKMCQWIKENLGRDVPLHFTRFTPAYRLTHLLSTPIQKLEEAYKIAKEVGLNYVYIGNVPGHIHNSTFCSKCQRRLIHRVHFSTLENNIEDGKCKFCGNKIPGIWR